MSIERIESIDKALGEYYESVGKTHYFSNGVGLFLNYCEANALDDHDIEFELKFDAAESILVDFDEHFPLKSSITDPTKRVKEIFRIIKCCNVFEQTPPYLEHFQQKPANLKPNHLQVVVKINTTYGTKVYFLIKKTTRLYKLMDAFCDRVGKESGTIRFSFKGDRIRPDMTPSELGIENNDVIHVIDAMLEAHGGGGGMMPGVPGPDLETLIAEDWNYDAKADRQLTWGLNIEFVIEDGQRIIGQFSQELDETITVDIVRDYKKAYCPSRRVHCPSIRSIVNYWFCGCKAHFKGVTIDGEEVDEVQVFGRRPYYYRSGNKQYAWLEITVSISDGNEQEESDDDDEYVPYFAPYANKRKKLKRKHKSYYERKSMDIDQ